MRLLTLSQTRLGRFLFLACVCAAGLAVIPAAEGRPAKAGFLHIGTSGKLTEKSGDAKEKSALKTLQGFIREETGMDNDIVRLESWRELVNKLAKGDVQVGVFQGEEYSWAKEKHPKLEPLALAVNVYRYPTAYVVTRSAGKAMSFADLKGQTFSMASSNLPFLRLFVKSQAGGKKPEAFFSKVTHPDNVEDALDDVVDGVVQATVVDRAALEAFKHRKPARFKKLRQIVHSQPVPPVVIACYESGLDAGTKQRFRTGLFGAGKKEKGKMMLTLFRLTGFDAVPTDFSKVVARTRKTYPPPK